MKASVILPALLLTFAPLHAQIAPNLMSYQGRVTDAAGVLIGNTSRSTGPSPSGSTPPPAAAPRSTRRRRP